MDPKPRARRAVTGSLRGTSTRDRDLEDAATIFRALGPQLGRPLIVAEADLLAAEIPDHDVAARLSRLLTSR